MGHEAIYKCKRCGKQFKSSEGGGMLFEEYRCVKCDTIKTVKTNNRSVPVEEYIPPSKDKIGVCRKCGGELRSDIGPMCPKCKLRDVEEIKIICLYD